MGASNQRKQEGGIDERERSLTLGEKKRGKRGAASVTQNLSALLFAAARYLVSPLSFACNFPHIRHRLTRLCLISYCSLKKKNKKNRDSLLRKLAAPAGPFPFLFFCNCSRTGNDGTSSAGLGLGPLARGGRRPWSVAGDRGRPGE